MPISHRHTTIAANICLLLIARALSGCHVAWLWAFGLSSTVSAADVTLSDVPGHVALGASGPARLAARAPRAGASCLPESCSRQSDTFSGPILPCRGFARNVVPSGFYSKQLPSHGLY